MTHRVGIIGLGTVGSRFVDQFERHADFEVVAAWDSDPSACSAHHSGVQVVGNAAEVIGAADAVYIAVPPLFHREYVEACLASRTAIFCEKPLGIDVAESRQLVEQVEQSGLPAGVNFVFSAAPSATGLQEVISSGAIGDVVRADLRLHFAQWPRAWHEKAMWLRNRDQGGWIREVVSHFLFLAGRVLGPVEVEYANVIFEDGSGGDLCEVEAVIRCTAGDSPLTIVGTSGGVGPDIVDFTVRGSGASARVVDWYRLQVSDGTRWSDRLDDVGRSDGADPYAAQLGQLSLMLDRRPSSIATFAEALAVQETVEEVLATN